jgi:hypothetical protein
MLKVILFISQAIPKLMIPAYLFALYAYAAGGAKIKSLLKIAVTTTLLFYPIAAFLETYVQYSVWLNGGVGKNFLPPVAPISYFLRYSFIHFWLGHLIGIALAVLFYLFLRLLGKRRPWLFLEGETELGFVCALIAGWPGFVLFLPLIFIMALPWTIFRQYVLKQERTTLSGAFLLAAGVVLLAGGWLIDWLGLGVLRI